MPKVERLTYEDVRPFRSLAARDRVTLENPENCSWLGVRNGSGTVVAFAALVTSGAPARGKTLTARFKSDWVRADYRGRGLQTLLIEQRVLMCVASGVGKATAFCTPASRRNYERLGFRAASAEGPTGITYMTREFR